MDGRVVLDVGNVRTRGEGGDLLIGVASRHGHGPCRRPFELGFRRPADPRPQIGLPEAGAAPVPDDDPPATRARTILLPVTGLRRFRHCWAQARSWAPPPHPAPPVGGGADREDQREAASGRQNGRPGDESPAPAEAEAAGGSHVY